MKTITFYFLLLASVWLASCNNQPPKPAHTDEEMIAAAKAVDAKFIEAMNKEDLNGVMSCYWNSPDLVVYPPGELETKGYDATKASFSKFFETTSGDKHAFTETNYKVVGDMVFGWGKVKMSMDGPDSTRIEMEGRYTDVLAYKDSALVYVVDHASVALPKPPPPPPAAAEKKKK